MENKNMIRTFYGFKPSKKITLSLIKILLVLIKKRERISKSKKISKLWQKLSEEQNMKFID